jgi:hypothetical protein
MPESSDIGSAQRLQARDDLLHQHLRRRRARGDADAYFPGYPLGPQLACIVDHIGSNALVGRDFAQAVGIRAVGRADDDHNVALLRQRFDCVLPVLVA